MEIKLQCNKHLPYDNEVKALIRKIKKGNGSSKVAIKELIDLCFPIIREYLLPYCIENINKEDMKRIAIESLINTAYYTNSITLPHFSSLAIRNMMIAIFKYLSMKNDFIETFIQKYDKTLEIDGTFSNYYDELYYLAYFSVKNNVAISKLKEKYNLPAYFFNSDFNKFIGAVDSKLLDRVNNAGKSEKTEEIRLTLFQRFETSDIKLLERTFLKLEERSAKILTLYYPFNNSFGKSYEEIAKIIGISVPVVKLIITTNTKKVIKLLKNPKPLISLKKKTETEKRSGKKTKKVLEACKTDSMEDIDFALKYIDKKSATIFKLHYGLIDGKFYTAKEITKKINDAEGGTNAVSDTTIKGCIRTVTARIQELIKLKKQNPINNSIYPFYLNLLSLVPTDKLDIALEKLSSFPSIARLYIELECGLIDGKTFTRYEAAKLLGIPHCKIVSNTIEVKQKLLQVINDESIEDISFSFIDKKNSKGEPEDIFYLEIPLAQKLRVVESFTDKISVAMKLYFTTWGSFRSRVEKVDEQLQIGYRATACRICRGKALFQEFVNNGERPTIKTKEQRIEENFGAKIEVIEAFIPYLDLDEQDVFTSVHGFGELEPTRLSLVAKNHHWSLTKTQGILINAEKIIRTGLAMMKANIFNKGDTKVELRDTSQRKDNTSKPNLPLKEKAQEDSNDASDANKKMEVLNKIFMHPYMNQERIVTSVITRQSYLTTERREMTSLVKVWTKESDHKSLLYECLDGPAELSIDQIIRKNHFPEAIAVNIIMSFLEFVNPNILEVLGLSEESFVLTHNYPLEESKPTC